MNNKNIFLGIAALIVIIGIIVFSGKNNKDQVVETHNLDTAITFTSPTSTEKVSVVFDTEKSTATLNGLGYDDLVLDSAVSASGARYENKTENIELWNRGEGVTISKNGQEIFSGNVGGQSDTDKLTASTWVWQASTIGDKVTEPKDESFTVTFNTQDGTMNATTDCNAVFGPYTVQNNTLTFGALGMTRKFCEGSQENVFAEHLGKVKSFSFNGSGALVLELNSGSDTMLFGKK